MSSMSFRVPGNLVRRYVKRFVPSTLWQPARSLEMRWRLAMFRPRWVEHTYAGFPLRVWLTDPVAQDWYDSDWPEPDEVSLLKLHAAHTGHGLTTGALVFDLGAHQAVMACMRGRIVGPSGRVVALRLVSTTSKSAQRSSAATESHTRNCFGRRPRVKSAGSRLSTASTDAWVRDAPGPSALTLFSGGSPQR
jgi:hypothetical protein